MDECLGDEDTLQLEPDVLHMDEDALCVRSVTSWQEITSAENKSQTWSKEQRDLLRVDATFMASEIKITAETIPP